MSFQLRRGGVIGGASIGALALVTVGAGLAGAQVSNPISVSPGTGAPGTTITVSGEDCDGTAVSLLLAGGGTIDTDEATVADGAWSGSLTADDELVEPGQTLTITATCLGGTMVYQSGSFVVSGVPPTTSSTTTSTTTTSTTAPPSPTTTSPGPGDGPDPTTPPTTTPPTPPTTDAPAPVPTPGPADPVNDNPDYAG